MINEDTVAFLQRVPPFQFLPPEDLRKVAENLTTEFYPKGTIILRQGGSPSESLRIIKKGGIKVSLLTEGGDEVVIDYRGEGDTFGFLSLISQDRVRSNITAVEDTICYLLGKNMLLTMLDAHLPFTEYFLKSHITRYIDGAYREMQDKRLFYSGSDRLLFTTRVEDIATKEAVMVTEDTPIREAAETMVEHRISSIVVTDHSGLPVGIVTDRDLREKVVARGRDVQEPVGHVMTSALIRVDAWDTCFEAVLKMVRYNIHHVLVVKEGRVAGVITNHDLMMLQGTSPLSLTKDIEHQQSVEGLVPVTRRINSVVGLLLKEGAKAGNIMKVVTEINDRLVRKILALAEKKFGEPPVPFCWLVYGSEGRREQIFKTDQDNALIYADPETPEQNRQAGEYFSAYAAYVRDALLRVGYPVCPAGYMASNPRWCRPLEAWKNEISDWVRTPTPDAVLNALAFFDFRGLYGETRLAEDLRDYLVAQLGDEQVLLSHLANRLIKNPPPIGFLKSFVVEQSGEHKDELNVKVKGVAPLVDIVRLFALERGVRETGTLGRIDALRDKHAIVREYADELIHAFEFILLLRIHHQYGQLTAREPLDNFINPHMLSNLEKRSLKEAFHLIRRIQDLIRERYKFFIC